MQMAEFHSFLWLSSIPLYTYTTSSLSIHLLMDTWVTSMSWLLWIVLLWTSWCIPSYWFLHDQNLSVLQGWDAMLVSSWSLPLTQKTLAVGKGIITPKSEMSLWLVPKSRMESSSGNKGKHVRLSHILITDIRDLSERLPKTEWWLSLLGLGWGYSAVGPGTVHSLVLASIRALSNSNLRQCWSTQWQCLLVTYLNSHCISFMTLKLMRI